MLVIGAFVGGLVGARIGIQIIGDASFARDCGHTDLGCVGIFIGLDLPLWAGGGALIGGLIGAAVIHYLLRLLPEPPR